MKKKYYRKRDNNFYLDKTKEEILSEIDYDNPKTFLPYLEILDYPYLEYEWNHYLQLGRGRNLNNIFSRYIALMRLKGYKSFSYQDSDYLNNARKKNDEILDEQILHDTQVSFDGLKNNSIINKIFEAGITEEKEISAMTLDEILEIQGITVAEIGMINDLQKAIKANKVITFLGGGEV